MAPFPPRAQIPVLNGWTDFQFGDRTQTQTEADENEEVALVGGGRDGRARPAGGCWFCPWPPVTVVPLPATGWGPEAPGAAGEQQASHQTYNPVWACDCSDRTWNCKQQSKMAGRTVVGADVLARLGGAGPRTLQELFTPKCLDPPPRLPGPLGKMVEVERDSVIFCVKSTRDLG